MRLVLALALAACPATAWEFSPLPVCTLFHQTDDASVTVTYDPRQAQAYTIAVTRRGGWPDSPGFSIRFEGQRSLTIATDRHRLSDGGATLSVSDTGFGNVLGGLEFNRSATAIAGSVQASLPLDGAAPEVAKFRACSENLSV